MTTELFYLLMSAILTAVLWIPYILGIIQTNGLMTAAYYDAPSTKALPNWVQRANRAHQNAVENIGPFAAIVLVAHLTGVSTGLTATAAAVFFYARIVHAVVHITGVRVLWTRTLVFAVAWAAMLTIAVQVLIHAV